MGRDLKRVALDFAWPIGMIWEGYIGPEDVDCEACSGTGDIGAEPCTECAGEGSHRNGWVRTDPPDGEGWQLWETTTEGSPQSPVFQTPEELCRWLVENGVSAFGKQQFGYEEWLDVVTNWRKR